MPRNLELVVDGSIFNWPLTSILGNAALQFETDIADMELDGMQLAITRSLFDWGKAKQLVTDGYVHSLHQSFAESGVAQIFLPSMEGSMKPLAGLESVAIDNFDTSLPLIVHPNEQDVGPVVRRRIDYRTMNASGNYGPLLHQPTIEVLDRWFVLVEDDPKLTARKMLQKQASEGFYEKAVALDLHHLISSRGKFGALPVRWCIEFAGELAEIGAFKYPGEVQMSFRPEFGGNREHLISAVNGQLDQTPHGVIFAEILKRLPDDQDMLRVTLEVRSNQFKKRDMPITYKLGNKYLKRNIVRYVLAA